MHKSAAVSKYFIKNIIFPSSVFNYLWKIKMYTVPNVTAHQSTASVPITVLLYNGPLLCGCNVLIKELINVQQTCFVAENFYWT